MKKVCVWLLAVSLLLLAAGCGKQPQQEAEAPAMIPVSTVDELLAAIAPGAQIQLAEGEYSLSSASDYGKSISPYYSWSDLGMGQYGLRLENLEDLTISGAGKGKTTLVTEPRWANVLSVLDCKNLTLENMTLGHTVTTSACEGGVVQVESSVNTTLTNLGLYGCGTLGVMAYHCGGLEMEGCEVYDCSIGGVYLGSSNNIAIRNTSFHSLGDEMPVQQVIDLYGCEDVTVSGCSFSGNYVNWLVREGGNGRVVFRNNEIVGNRLSGSMFCFQSPGIVLDGNTFDGNEVRSWYVFDSFPGIDAFGNEVIFEEPEKETIPVTPGVANPVSTGEQKQVRVSTVEEFLGAIASDTCIILEAELLDFSQCQEYETLLAGSDNVMVDNPAYYPEGVLNYYWMNEFDGPGLIICDVHNLTILAEGEDRTAHTLSAVPRYSDVLTFENCSAITLSGFTAGHTMEPGQCTGGVFRLKDCEDVLIDNCGMFGCGTEGVNGENSRNIQIVNSEIYECSYTGIELKECENVAISGTVIRDIENEWQEEAPYFTFWGSSNVTLDGEPLDGNYIGR